MDDRAQKKALSCCVSTIAQFHGLRVSSSSSSSSVWRVGWRGIAWVGNIQVARDIEALHEHGHLVLLKNDDANKEFNREKDWKEPHRVLIFPLGTLQLLAHSPPSPLRYIIQEICAHHAWERAPPLLHTRALVSPCGRQCRPQNCEFALRRVM